MSLESLEHVIAMFESGAGIEVIENMSHMSARAYLPMTYLQNSKAKTLKTSAGTPGPGHANTIMLSL
ncbi:unnamed protein product [Orchesella dallaii]|uniref:Uncharacterized protein n=1 Tax=Orchesella dallaii TaxID=48710 RepID=A0ABP1SB98_9HEXA